ncbi:MULTISPECIES: fumarylacetoacetase [Ramlibacter]|uniref:fumarylacetoacetase n=1 Tax=Ramlibacter aquaticus TaxID=2780094 RepID=A0ABR9SK44_9BURK|nr:MULTISPECIES: fumarylacetoacetase [Ramlibacter]MBE7942274.1 fumarylacetoacetase [Ramlibacter aquaticus]
MNLLNETHDPALRSWVTSANAPGCDFPVQNLPFGRFRTAPAEPWRIGVAIGDEVLDLRAAGLLDHAAMAQVLTLPQAERSALRLALSRGLRAGSRLQAPWSTCLHAQTRVELGLPCDVGDYTDFYVGIHHATAVGKLFRPDNPLLPNYKWVPIGYHGRSSTLIPSGTPFVRPRSQVKAVDAEVPTLQPSARLDFELELGIVVGPGNAAGEPVAMAQAEDHVFGLTLFNDWSARDVQAWEYQPLGPFLSKNFASTVSPWIVTMEALAPYRQAFTRPEGDPQPLPYLHSEDNAQAGAFGIELEVWLQTAAMRASGHAGECISRSNFAEAAYWTVAQLVAHHTVNGCTLRPGDLFGSGTLSGPRPEQAGSLLELTQGGKAPIRMANGETRTFLEDGDEVTLKGVCRRPGAASIGFGSCSGKVLPALSS